MIVDLADDAVAVLVATLNAEVPDDVDLGDGLAAVDLGGVQVLSTTGTWLLDPQGLATRLAPLPGIGTEATRWSGGVELAREIIRDTL